jgi:hypothetical protein
MPPLEMLVFSTEGDQTRRIEFPEGAEVKIYNPIVQSEFWEDIKVPIFDSTTDFDDEFLEEIHAWAGALQNEITSFISVNSRPNNFTSSFSPLIKTDKGEGTTFQWKGFITPSFVNQQLVFLRDNVDSGEFPWAMLTVWGFEDTPVSFKECQHFNSFSGENNFTIILFPGGEYVLSAVVGPEDEFS